MNELEENCLLEWPTSPPPQNAGKSTDLKMKQF